MYMCSSGMSKESRSGLFGVSMNSGWIVLKNVNVLSQGSLCMKEFSENQVLLHQAVIYPPCFQVRILRPIKPFLFK